MVKSVRKVPKYGIVPCIAPYKDKHSTHVGAQHNVRLSKQHVVPAEQLKPHHCSLYLPVLASPSLSAAVISCVSVSGAPWHSSPGWRTLMSLPAGSINYVVINTYKVTYPPTEVNHR